MEYVRRVTKLSQQQQHRAAEIINKRNKREKSRWNHPREPNAEANPNLYDHDWTIAELTKRFHAVDKQIVDEFTELGMNESISDDPLFKVFIFLQILKILRSF